LLAGAFVAAQLNQQEECGATDANRRFFAMNVRTLQQKTHEISLVNKIEQFRVGKFGTVNFV
jgi:hypothetical protein